MHKFTFLWVVCHRFTSLFDDQRWILLKWQTEVRIAKSKQQIGNIGFKQTENNNHHLHSDEPPKCHISPKRGHVKKKIVFQPLFSGEMHHPSVFPVYQPSRRNSHHLLTSYYIVSWKTHLQISERLISTAHPQKQKYMHISISCIDFICHPIISYVYINISIYMI